MATRAEFLALARKRNSEMIKLGLVPGEVERLIVEPVLKWAGFATTRTTSVRRIQRLAPCIKPASFVCTADGAKQPHVAVWVQEDLGDAWIVPALAALTTWRSLVAAERAPTIVAFTNGSEWRLSRFQGEAGYAAPSSSPIEDDGALDALRAPVPVAIQAAVGGAEPHAPSGGPAPAPGQPAAGATPGGQLPAPTPAPVAATKPGSAVVGPDRALSPGPSPRTSPTGVPLRSYREHPYIPAKETNTKPRYVEIDGERFSCSTWIEVVERAARFHLERRNTLPTGRLTPKQSRVYFTREPGDLNTRPRELPHGWWMEGCLNAKLACDVTMAVLRLGGAKEYDIRYE